jgi:hypothetical protein
MAIRVGANAYAGKGKIISVRNRRALYALGPDGSEILPAVAFIQKKLIGLRKTYEIYRLIRTGQRGSSGDREGR